jgi:hypothetical protein
VVAVAELILGLAVLEVQEVAVQELQLEQEMV